MSRIREIFRIRTNRFHASVHMGSEEIPDGTQSFPEVIDIPQAVHMMKMPTHPNPFRPVTFLQEMASARKTEGVKKKTRFLNRERMAIQDGGRRR
jgi:hypothetical protein